MSRVRSFAAPHKGLRNVISKFSLCLGYTEFSNKSQLYDLKTLGQEMFTLLKDHVTTENTHTLKHLEARLPGASKHDMEEHEELEGIQNDLERRLLELNGRELPDETHRYYLDFSLFHSLYLEHIHEEETVTEILMQEHFSDEELIQHRMEIMQKLPFSMLCLWLKYIVPAQSHEESMGMLSGLKQNAPSEAFEAVIRTIEQEMAPGRFKALISKFPIYRSW